MKQWVEVWQTKKNRKDDYIKMVWEKDCWSFQTNNVWTFSEVMVNVTELYLLINENSTRMKENLDLEFPHKDLH